jgi:hypothetical protein
MRLADLDPRWLLRGEERCGLIFRCPHCRNVWLTCFFATLPREEQFRIWGNNGGELDEDGWPEKGDTVVFCSPKAKWSIIAGSTFEDLSVTPSVDASASGHWHGHLTAGAITGGL